MPLFLGFVCYLSAAVTLVGAGIFGLAVLFSLPPASDLDLPPATQASVATGGKRGAHPVEHRLLNTPRTEREFRIGPKIDHAQGSNAVDYSRQALEEARSAMAQERTIPLRKRAREHRQIEIVPPGAPTVRLEYPPERPSGH